MKILLTEGSHENYEVIGLYDVPDGEDALAIAKGIRQELSKRYEEWYDGDCAGESPSQNLETALPKHWIAIEYREANV